MGHKCVRAGFVFAANLPIGAFLLIFRARKNQDERGLTFSGASLRRDSERRGGARRGEKKSTSRKKSRSLARRGLSALPRRGECVRTRSCVRACVRVRGLSRVRRENSFSGPHETIKSRRRGGDDVAPGASFLFFVSLFLSLSILSTSLSSCLRLPLLSPPFFHPPASVASLIMRNSTRISMASRDY